jgi:hypothetical protein
MNRPYRTPRAEWVQEIYNKYPQLYVSALQDTDLLHEHRVVLRCPRNGHAVETVVLEASPGGEHLYVSSAHLIDNNYTAADFNHLARNTFEAAQGRSEEIRTVATDRMRLVCPRKKCRYSGVKTQRELVRLLVLARFVLDTPDIRLPD